MIQPPGFSQQALNTSLGTLIYYSADSAFWQEGKSQPSDGPDLRPPLVFLHGFGGGSSAYEWSKVYPAFAIDYHVLAPDLLGWGRSEHLSRGYQVEDYLTTIKEFLEQLCPQPTTVVASSLTAAMLVRVAIAYPKLFKSLILTSPSGLSDFEKDYSRTFFAQLVSTPVLDRILYSTGLATSGGIRSFLEKRQFARANRVSQEMVDAYLTSAQQPKAEYSALSFVRGDLCFDLAEYLPRLTTPTAILWGKQCQFTSYEIGQRLAELNPKAIKVLEILEDVGLTPHLELPAVTIGLIRKFLAML
ncbi:MAG: alpha/beta hydrolase [Oscillatoriophycideae cyanobacterium NC_groundwater_1537_Pr4_S-0.65um_50_18]|nr:alpha/beta hydrolase [Oscillatoriophycideae cyanobacterium NC_groundwater_1537_Pr4_S-0.65um_50_18]